MFTGLGMFVYIKRVRSNLLSIYNTQWRKIELKFDENENTLAYKLDFQILNHFSYVGIL